MALDIAVGQHNVHPHVAKWPGFFCGFGQCQATAIITVLIMSAAFDKVTDEPQLSCSD